MQVPLQVVFRGLDRSDAVEAKVREAADKLAHVSTQIVACRVSIESPHHHHAAGRVYHVRIDATLPSRTLVASRESDAHHAYTDVYVAVRDAFDAMRRQIEEYEQKRRGEVKTHATRAPD